MQLLPEKFATVIQVMRHVPDNARMFLREVCELDDPDSADLDESHCVLLELYRFLQVGARLDSGTALRVCGRVKRSKDMQKRLLSIRKAFESESRQAKMHDALVIIYDNQMAKWFGGDKFYNLKTGELADTLPFPPASYTAWDAAVTLVRILQHLKRRREDVHKAAEAAGLADQ